MFFAAKLIMQTINQLLYSITFNYQFSDAQKSQEYISRVATHVYYILYTLTYHLISLYVYNANINHQIVK